MKKIGYVVRPYIHKSGRVMVRVRWNSSKIETVFSTECSADPEKWSKDANRAKINTTHNVNGVAFSAKEINSRIENVIDVVSQVFYQFEVEEKMPSADELKQGVNMILRPVLSYGILTAGVNEEAKGLYLQDLLDDFIVSRPMELNWGPKTSLRYKEVVDKYYAYAKKKQVRLLEINKKTLTEFKSWFFDSKVQRTPYSNYTVMKHFSNLKGMLKWGRDNGYKIHPESLTFKGNIHTIRKTVTFLNYDEIELFASFVFPASKNYLDHVRDVFCFGCYTSLRHSDLYSLRKANVKGDTIEIVTQKTDDLLHIPLIPQAKAILEKYKDMPGDRALPVVSDQKSNTYIKEAAKLAGLNREIVEVNMVGNERVESVCKLHETISMHDARRSFVVNSLAFGIPANVVSACTGHANLNTMRPYIATSNLSVKREMKKWGTMPLRKKIDAILDDLSEDKLNAIYKILLEIK